VRISRRFLTVLGAPLLCSMMLLLVGAPAMAASSNPPGNGSFFEVESEVNGGLCAQESGTTSTIVLVKCSATDNADLWYNPTNDLAEIANKGTGKCFSVTGFEAQHQGL
jgi:hypothetical protein